MGLGHLVSSCRQCTQPILSICWLLLMTLTIYHLVALHSHREWSATYSFTQSTHKSDVLPMLADFGKAATASQSGAPEVLGSLHASFVAW